MIDALPLLLGPEGYQISRSVRLRQSASAYFDRSVASSGNLRKWTVSCWVKRGSLGAWQYLFTETNEDGSGANIKYTVMGFNTSNQLVLQDRWGSSPGDESITTSAVFRDPSAWYHVVFVRDSDNATQADRAIIYVNGVRQAVTGSFTQSKDSSWNLQTTAAYGQEQIGRFRFAGTWYYGSDFYMTEVNSIDGQALTPASFGETNAVTGVWQPKKYTGTYGTNGFYLNFSDNSSNTATTIGKDYSGNGNNWTPNNISVTAGVTYDSMLDVPTQWADGGNGRGNYATLNPVANPSTLLNANLTTNAGDKFSISTIGMTTGKWYCEVTVTTVGAESSVGISTQPYSGSNPYVGGTSTSWGYYSNNGNKYTNASSAAYGATYTTGDVIGIAFDADNGTLEFFKNNTSQGTAYTGLTSGPYFFAVEGRTTTSANNCSINFGQRPFAYTPPSGFKALNTLNLPTPTILKGNQYFDATTYTGTGASLNVVNSGGMQPDFVWTKPRSTAVGHTLFDSLRGVTKYLQSNTTGAEGTAATSLTAFNSDGFTVNSDTSTGANGVTYVGWQWKEGATQGFDIVTYTGNGANRTIAHNLGVAPKMIIVKSRSSGTYSWAVYHASTGAGNYLTLNATTASTALAAMWNSTAPTSSVFSVGTDNWVNANTATYVAYLFAEVAGFSKFGSYTGNGSADGPFCFTGFLPRWIMIKRTDATADWVILDTARDSYNMAVNYLVPNTSGAETAGSSVQLDSLSSGFKVRGTWAGMNANGGTYVYACFASNPFKNSLAR